MQRKNQDVLKTKELYRGNVEFKNKGCTFFFSWHLNKDMKGTILFHVYVFHKYFILNIIRKADMLFYSPNTIFGHRVFPYTLSYL